MLDAIESLNDRDDVARTEITRRGEDGGTVTVEMWHNIETLQNIVERSMGGGPALSQKGMQKRAEREALAVRETTIDINAEMDALYPDVVEQLKEEADHEQDYEYNVSE